MIGCDYLRDVLAPDNLSNLDPRYIGLPLVNSAEHAGIERQVKHAQQDAAGGPVRHDIVLKAEAVRLQPPRWEGRKDDLTAYGVRVHVLLFPYDAAIKEHATPPWGSMNVRCRQASRTLTG